MMTLTSLLSASSGFAEGNLSVTLTGPSSGLVDQLLNFTATVNGDNPPFFTTFCFKEDPWVYYYFGPHYNQSICCSHAFSDVGTFEVKVTVTDNNNNTAYDSIFVEINSRNPVANPGGPYHAYINSTVFFDGSGSYDPDGFIIGYKWDFDGDDNWDTPWMDMSYTSHVYAVSDTYTVKLKVRDNDYKESPIGITYAYIDDGPPLRADAGGPYSGWIGVGVSQSGYIEFDGHATGGNPPYTWRWDFNQDGIIDSNLEDPTYYYPDTIPAEYTITLTVTDNENNIDDSNAHVSLKFHVPDRLMPGDIMMMDAHPDCGWDPQWYVQGDYNDHAAIYVGNNKFRHAWPKTECRYADYGWFFKWTEEMIFGHVHSSDATQRSAACQWAAARFSEDYQNFYLWPWKCADPYAHEPFANRWYCMELVWGAYMNCNGPVGQGYVGIDIDQNGWDPPGWVSGNDILGDIEDITWYYELIIVNPLQINSKLEENSNGEFY